MNIIRGIDRIAVVLAVVSIVPGFIGGWEIYKEERTVSVTISAEDFLKDKVPKSPAGLVLDKVYHLPLEIPPGKIPINITLAEAPSYGQTIFEYSPRSYGAEDYLRLCKKIASGG